MTEKWLSDEELTAKIAALEENYKIGRPQTTYDKQLLIEELTKLGWNQHAPMPIISKEMTIQLSKVYKEIYQKITGDKI